MSFVLNIYIYNIRQIYVTVVNMNMNLAGPGGMSEKH